LGEELPGAAFGSRLDHIVQLPATGVIIPGRAETVRFAVEIAPTRIVQRASAN